VDRREAAAVLGVGPSAPAHEVRDAYRRRIRARHPDRAGGAATGEAARIIEAYAVLRTLPVVIDVDAPVDIEVETHRGPPRFDTVTLVDDDTVGFTVPADEVFGLLLDAAHEIGDVTYVDPEGGLLEAFVTLPGRPVCSLLLSLQGRADLVDAFCTVESLDAGPAPPVGDVISLLLGALRARLRARRS